MNPYHDHHVLRIRRKVKESRYLQKKGVYKYHRYELTISTRCKDLLEPFMDKDLHVTVKQTSNNSLILEIKPVERTGAP